MDTYTEHYFLASHTGKGYVHFFDEAMQSLDYVYVLKRVPGNGESTLLKNVAAHFQAKGERLDLIHQAADADELEGLILKDRHVGVFEGTAPHVLEPDAPYVDGEYIDLSQAVCEADLTPSKDQIRRLKEASNEAFDRHLWALAEMLSLHEDLEALYAGELDIEAANQLAEDTIHAIFGDASLGQEATVKDRFFESSTQSQHIDFVHELTKDCTTRYFITGRPGSGKSVFMTKIADAARERGYDVERYHCGFDPDSLDMIRLPQLGVAAFDSTPPHDRQPSRDGDVIIDTAALLKVDSDEVYEQQIADIKTASQQSGDRADDEFHQAIQAFQDMAALYEQAVDFDKMKEIETDLIKKISD